MMIGRDESMPNNVREPDMPSEERERVRELAQQHLRMYGREHTGRDCVVCALAPAILRYVPAGVPVPAPQAIAAADDMTRRVTPAGLPAAGVICEPIEEESSGVVEPSDDGEGTRRVGDLGLTRAIDLNDATRR